MKKSTLITAVAATAFGAFTNPCAASIALSNSGGYLAITIDTPMVFVTTGATNGFPRLIWEDVFVTSATGDTQSYNEANVGNITLSDGTTTLTPWSAWGILSFSPFGLFTDRNDLVLSWQGSLSIGGTLTVSAGTVVTSKLYADFPALNGTGGNVLLTNSTGNGISAPQYLSVEGAPEPSAAALLGLGGLVFFRRKR